MPEAGKCVYKVSDIPGQRFCKKPCDPDATFQLCAEHDGKSSNGRTLAFDPNYLGSNPSFPSKLINGLSSNGRTARSECAYRGSSP